MNKFESPQQGLENREYPKELQEFWELLEHMLETNTTPAEYSNKLKTITESLAEKDPEFQEILKQEKAEKGTEEGMMDALERYSLKLTEAKES